MAIESTSWASARSPERACNLLGQTEVANGLRWWPNSVGGPQGQAQRRQADDASATHQQQRREPRRERNAMTMCTWRRSWHRPTGHNETTIMSQTHTRSQDPGNGVPRLRRGLREHRRAQPPSTVARYSCPWQTGLHRGHRREAQDACNIPGHTEVANGLRWWPNNVGGSRAKLNAATPMAQAQRICNIPGNPRRANCNGNAHLEAKLGSTNAQ